MPHAGSLGLKAKRYYNMIYSYDSNPGKLRDRNEDACLILENGKQAVLMMVLDGMGGHNKGDLASSKVRDFIKDEFLKKKHFIFPKKWLKKVVKNANLLLYKFTEENPKFKGMGTTLSLYLIVKGKTYLVYIGDSRAYTIKDNNINQESVDETYVQFLYEQGQIKKEDMENHPQKNVLINSMGSYSKIRINIKEISNPYDYLLLCTDGLYNMIEEKIILDVIAKYSLDISKAVKRLITRANMRGGKDNVSVCLLKVGDNHD